MLRAPFKQIASVLPSNLSNTKDFNKYIQGTLDWRMHDFLNISCVVWKDMRLVLIIFSRTNPIALPCQPIPTLLWRNGVEHPLIPTSPTHMCGVDVADHLRGSYSCQTRTHRVSWFLLDTLVVNTYLMYFEVWKTIPKGKRPLTHL